jgi:prevent-host-death family protein
MTTVTVTEAKRKFLGLMRKSHDTGEVYSVTHNGLPYAVMLAQEEYDGMLETLEILQDKTFARDLASRIRAADKGDTVSFEEAVGRKQRK